MDLTGKVAVVTGGSRGIGKAVSLRLGGLGATVVINYVSRPDAAQETADQVVKAGGKAAVYQFNVADSAAVEHAFKRFSKITAISIYWSIMPVLPATVSS